MNTSTKSLHLVLAVELINFLGWMGNGDYFEIFLDFWLRQELKKSQSSSVRPSGPSLS